MAEKSNFQDRRSARDAVLGSGEDHKDFTVTCGIRATIQITNDSERVMGRIIGLSDGEIIIVRMAAGDVFREISDYRHDVIIRFASEGNVHGFKAPVLGTLEQPPVLFVRWPYKVQSVKLRVHERVPCFVNAVLRFGEFQIDVAIRDLSAGGCRISAGKHPEKARAVFSVDQSVMINIPTRTAGIQQIGAKIKNIDKDEIPRCGLMFENMTQDQQLAIDQLMDDIKAVW